MPLKCAVHAFCDGNIFDVLTNIFSPIFLWRCFYYHLLVSFLFNSSISFPFYLICLYAAKYILNTLCLQTLVAVMSSLIFSDKSYVNR